MKRLLLVDDDKEYCDLLIEYIQSTSSFAVDFVNNGEDCIKKLHDTGFVFSVVLLDVTMPKQDGFETLKSIRKKSNIPVIMLTARGNEIDRVVGLEIGADDYIAKPFSPRELSARIKALLRRTKFEKKNKPQFKNITVGNLVLNTQNREAYSGTKQLFLTAKEFLILKTLVEKKGFLMTKQELTKVALGRDLELYDRSIDMHISNLRQKLDYKPNSDSCIKTIRGAGYIYQEK